MVLRELKLTVYKNPVYTQLNLERSLEKTSDFETVENTFFLIESRKFLFMNKQVEIVINA